MLRAIARGGAVLFGGLVGALPVVCSYREGRSLSLGSIALMSPDVLF